MSQILDFDNKKKNSLFLFYNTKRENFKHLWKYQVCRWFFMSALSFSKIWKIYKQTQ